MKKCLLYIFFLFINIACVFAQESLGSIEIDLKYHLLIQKAERAEKTGNYEEAAQSYQEAYEESNNVQPLMQLAKLYTRLGMYDTAKDVIDKIPIKKLRKAGKSEVHLLEGKIQIAKGNLGDAHIALNKTLKLTPNKFPAKVRLAMINLIKGMKSEAEKQLDNVVIKDNIEYDIDEYRLCFAIDMHNGNFARAYKACELISKINTKNNPKIGFFEAIMNQPIIILVSFLPLLLSKYLAVIYYLVVFMALGLCASALCKKSAFWQIFLFVFAGIILMTLSYNFSITDVYSSFLNGYCYIYDEMWIIPRLIIGSNLFAFALFILYPCFKLLKEDIRPVTYELLGIWLFCFFFSSFVLSFQSNLPIIQKLTYMSIGLIFSFLSSLIMPFGKLVVFRITQLLGLSSLIKISGAQITKENISFTDMKILETKIWNYISKGDIETAFTIGKKALTIDNQKNFPYFWQGFIFALINRENYEEAINSINNYYMIFQGTEYYEIGQIYEAYIKTEKGDFLTAYKIINSISSDRAKLLNADETAISLLVLARCCLNSDDANQAHINYNKALSTTKSSLLRYIILTDIAELDCKLKYKQDMPKWKKIANNLNCEGKCLAYRSTINSIVAYTSGMKDEAFTLASECLNCKIKTGKAIAWLGHLLCKQGKPSEAEKLLSRMTAGSYSAECLMVEITSL